MTRSLTIDDFDEFFREVHRDHDADCGPSPFPWQSRLARQVAATGIWPAVLDLPTGSGKTAVIDIAVFVLALRDDQPRRMVFVVDRRIVVHQAARRARRIAERLRDADGGVTGLVATRLSRLIAPIGVDQAPLQYAELRGGIERDDEWARRPDTPTVLVSTVDQVGSRLLFRGYGVSDGMRPVHAGLLGNDVLYFLDEVHLARPYAETLAAVGRRYRPPAGSTLPDRWTVVEMSATPTASPPDAGMFGLDGDDRDPDRASALVRRLRAAKPARTELVKARPGADQRAALASAAVSHARRLLGEPGVRTIGVVVNRVETAVGIYRQLRSEQPDLDAVLLTGRMRPLERDVILARYEPRLRTGRVRSDDDQPLVVVATMAIEAGADIDLDALVTECASLDALVQRFGRVDRAGDLTASGRRPTSVILATSTDVASKANDPVYGPALAGTWAWLRDHPLDFGIDVLPGPATWPAGVTRRPDPVPQLLPSHLDRWVQTSARPDADPDPAHWLHGLRPSRPEVNVVWRADVLPDAFSGDNGAERLVRLVSICPPGSGEAMSLPLAAVRAWLAARTKRQNAPVGVDTSVADVPDAVTGALEPPDRRPAGAYGLLWRGDRSRLATSVRDIQPGDTLVVPASYGGIRAGCWDPDCQDAADDYGTQVQAVQRGRAVLRLAPGCLPGVPELPPPRPQASPDQDDRHADLGLVREWLSAYSQRMSAGAGLGPAYEVITRVAVRLTALGNRQVELVAVELADGADAPRAFVLRSRRRLSGLGARGAVAGADSEPATSSFTGQSVALDDHLADVESVTRQLATAAGLPDMLVEDLARAGRLHDLGKADPRFQTLLRGGGLADPDLGLAVLAKSGLDRSDYAARQRARIAAGYPAQARHELGSVALVQHDDRLRAEATDWDLVLHLIASHHGHARPFVPVADDPQPPELTVDVDGRRLSAPGNHGLMRLDSGVPERFWRGVRRYGWWGLAWLEALLRLADHRASEKAQGGDD